jgi:Mitochondrial carrier protein
MSHFKYKSDLDAIKQITKVEGIRGLYKAYGATVFSFGPFSALYFMFYEQLKSLLVGYNVISSLRNHSVS